jgi:preprotein translocase subunit SecA
MLSLLEKKALENLKKTKTFEENFHQKTKEELFFEIRKTQKKIQEENLLGQSFQKIPSNLLQKWFALVKEISFRTIGLKHFDTQLLAGFYLLESSVVEMKTGEGKTLVLTLPASTYGAFGKGCHVITVNDYLAERDQKWMGKIYQELGLSIGLITSQTSFQARKKAYQADITYGTNSEFVFDYLRKNTALSTDTVVQGELYACILDEIDSILIDEARTPLILSEKEEKKKGFFKIVAAKKIISYLESSLDFEINFKTKDIFLKESGYNKINEILGVENLYDGKDSWILEIMNALKAKYLYRQNQDYVVFNKNVFIIDEFTGRIMPDRRWSLGIHEAIEAKENLPIKEKTKPKSSITYQNFFKNYSFFSGTTGTALTEKKEFQDIYGLEVIVLSPMKPILRQDKEDLFFFNETAKWKAIIKEAKQCYEKGQPILIGTTSIEKSEILSDLFQSFNIPHQVLNAKPENIKKESEIIAQAGQAFAVTIATNMAGRGTDILLGGNPSFFAKQSIQKLFERNKNTEIHELLSEYQNDLKALLKDIENLPYSLEECKDTLKNLYHSFFQKNQEKTKKENEKVLELGGLCVIGTERHESRRIDNQLRGRAGRQGDPGSSQFYLSLDDKMLQLFGANRSAITTLFTAFVDKKDAPIESSLLTKSIEDAQKKVENFNAEIRKNLFEYEKILESQRKIIFTLRSSILKDSALTPEFLLKLQEEFRKKQGFSLTSVKEEQKNGFYFPLELDSVKKKSYWVNLELEKTVEDSYQSGFFQKKFKSSTLKLLDLEWKKHLERCSYLKETISWLSYGQKNPIEEYNLQIWQSYNIMIQKISFSMIYFL